MAFAKELLYSGPKLEDELKKAQAQRPIVEDTEAVEAKTGEIGKSIAAENSPKEKSAVDQFWERGSQTKQDVMSAAAKAKVKANAAKKELENYLSSDEYKQRTAEREKRLAQERAIKQLMTGIVDLQEPQLVKDEKEDQLRAAADLAQRDAKDAQDLEDLNGYIDGLTENPARMTQDQGVMATDLKEFASMPYEDRRALEMYVAQRDADYYDTLNFAQNGIQAGRAEQQAAGLFEKYGKQRVDELAETFARYRNEKTSQEVAQAAQKQGSSLLSGTAASAAAIPAGVYSGVGGVMGYAKEAGNRTGRYSTMDPNNEGNFLGTYSGSVKSNVSQNIENSIFGKAGSIVYQAVMSTAESIARAYLGGGAAGGAGLAATATFSQTMADAAKQGATPGQAALLATADAAIEYLTEKIPLDEMISAAKGSNLKALLVNTLRQAGIEASTEELSLVGSLIAEAAILKDKSAYNLEVKDLMEQGMTEEEAKKQATQGIWQEAVNTALVSGLSGGFSGAASTLKGAYSSAQDAKVKAGTEQAAQQVQAAPETAQTEQAQQTAPQVEQADQIGKSGYKNEVPQSINAVDPGATPKAESTVTAETATQSTNINSPDATPKADSAGTSINSIPQNRDEINGNSVNPEPEIKGTGAAEQNFTGKAAYQDLLTDENTQRDRPGDVRPMEVPKQDAYGRKVSEFVGNAYGAEVTPDRMANEIESLVQEGALGFDRRTNKQSLENARQYIYGSDGAKGKGEAGTRNEITRNISNGKLQDGDIEKAMILYSEYANRKSASSQENAAELMVDLSIMANMTGRNLQLFKLLRRMTPEGQLMAVQKGVQRNVENMVKSGQVKKGYEASLDPELMQDYLDAAKESKNATDPKKQKEAEQRMKDTEKAIYAAEAAKMPATFKAKWDAWRYMSMLGNAKTQVRNIAGNAMFMPYKAVKDKMGALMEKALPKEQRTKSLTTDRELLDWAKADAKTESVQDALKYSAKLGDDVSAQKLSDGRKVFESKVLETMRQWTQKVPEAGDMIFKNPYYAKSLAGFLRARGYSAGDIQSGAVSDTVLDEGRAYAINEAMKATFNDSNAFSDFMANELRYKGDNPIGKAANTLAEGVIPFRRTPANIVVRFTEYSPVGVMRGLVNMGKSIANGKVTASDAIDQIAAGLTGSAAMALGAYLASGAAGIKLTGSGTEDDEARQGHQDYALEFTIGGQEYSYKIDWAAPANMPLFVGANIYAMLQSTGEDTDVSKFTAFLRGMGTMLEPMLSLSCMSSLNDILESVSYADDGEKLYSLAASAATSYFTQGIPALARQSAQALQEYKQSTFANSDDPTIRDAQKTAANIPFSGVVEKGIGFAGKALNGGATLDEVADVFKSGVKGNAFQMGKTNAWGEKEKNASGTDDLMERVTGTEADDRIARVVDAFVNPGTLKKIDNGAVEKEITRLNSVQENSVTPPYAAKTISYTDSSGEKHLDQRLTEEQYQTLSTTQGETAKRIVTEMIGSKDYAAMTDEQKALAIRQAYTYARETGEITAMDDHYGYSESWMKQLKEGKEAAAILRRVANSEFNKAFSALDDAWDNNWDSAQDSEALRTAYDSYKSMTLAAKREVRGNATGTAAKYIEAREKGISHEDFLAAAENVATVKGTGSNGTVRDIDRRKAIANTTGLSQKEIDTIMKCYMPDYDPNDDSPNTTEVKYDYIRQEMGLSAKEYVAAYQAYLDTEKRKPQIAAIQESLGCDYGTALKLYNVYSGDTWTKRTMLSWYEK